MVTIRGIGCRLASARQYAEPVTARKRIAELEAELAIHRRSAELLAKVVPLKEGSRPSR